jgi:hypothetical protein
MRTRKELLNILASELEASEGLPLNADKHLAALRDDVDIGPGLEAALRAMRKVEAGAK